MHKMYYTFRWLQYYSYLSCMWFLVFFGTAVECLLRFWQSIFLLSRTEQIVKATSIYVFLNKIRYIIIHAEWRTILPSFKFSDEVLEHLFKYGYVEFCFFGFRLAFWRGELRSQYKRVCLYDEQWSKFHIIHVWIEAVFVHVFSHLVRK